MEPVPAEEPDEAVYRVEVLLLAGDLIQIHVGLDLSATILRHSWNNATQTPAVSPRLTAVIS